MARIVVALILAGLWQTDAAAQQFRPRGQTSYATTNTRAQGEYNAGREQPSKASSVSADLLQLYSQTATAKTEADYTTIARGAAKALADNKRVKADKDYAGSLLAWALNRRGELRSENAGQLVASGQSEPAKELDQLATDDFATSVEYAPDNWRHRHNYGIALAMHGDYPHAIEQLSKAIQLNPKYANARFNRGELQFETGKYEAAEEDYTAAIDLSQDAQYYNSRAHCRFVLEKFDDALADYEQAVQLQADNAMYQTDLGDALQYMGKWESAAKAYRSAVAADNTYVRAYQNAAWLMATCPVARFRNEQLAMSAAKKALELSGERTAETVETLAAATAALGKHAEAAKLQEEALKLATKQQTEPAQLTEFQQRLDIYRAGQAYVQPEPQVAEQNPTRTASR